MNREQFFDALATLDEPRLKKTLWNLYWRGSAALRERIEAELAGGGDVCQDSRPQSAADPELVLTDVQTFVALARSGAYMAGDRRVSPRERSRWRFTFQRLVASARDALRVDDAGADALEQLIDFAREMRDYDYFHSEDPVEAARFVVSDAAALLWGTVLDRSGFPAFAERASPQLIRWESRHGWTRRGDGRTSEREISLASVLAGLLNLPDMWVGFADRYLDALDKVDDGAVTRSHRAWPSPRTRERRAATLAEWHHLLFVKLVDTEAEDRLDRLARHPALGGPELGLVRARLAHWRGDVDQARSLMHQSLQELPGHQGLLDFATEIGAPLPPRAQQVLTERRLAGGRTR